MTGLQLLKWCATGVLILGTLLNSINIYPAGAIVLVVGGTMWLTAAIRMRDRPLIITNAVMTLVGLLGLMFVLWTGGVGC